MIAAILYAIRAIEKIRPEQKTFQAATEFEHVTTVIPAQLSNQLSYEAITGRAEHSNWVRRCYSERYKRSY